MNLRPKFSSSAPLAVVFTPANRFFMRIVPLAADVPVLDQVALALEGFAPFPLAQLYWGCCIAPARDRALICAAYRRRFTPDEVRAWEAADLVVPDVVPLLGSGPTEAGARVLTEGNRLSGLAWNGQSPWPVAVLAREYPGPVTGEIRRDFTDELKARAGLQECPVSFVEGMASVRGESGTLIMEFPSASTITRISSADQDLLDVRDRGFTARRRSELRRGELVWRLLLAGGAAAALALLLDAGGLAFRWLDQVQRTRATGQQSVVAKLEAAHGLVGKVDELAHRQLRFFEMLELVNESRPRSIQFTRTGASGRNSLEIEAHTDKAEDVPAYEAALRRLPALEKVEVRGLRARDGQTVFALQIAFKGEVPAAGGAP